MLIQILLMVADSSLGVKTLDPNKLKELIKSKFDDALPSGRFQIFNVDDDDSIKNFVIDQGVEFNAGRGFYELSRKSVKVQSYKEIIIMDKSTGDIFNGPEVRDMLGLVEESGDKNNRIVERLKPTHFDQYKVFIQSTSHNRKLLGGTCFMYEVGDWDKAAFIAASVAPKKTVKKKSVAKKPPVKRKVTKKAIVTKAAKTVKEACVKTLDKPIPARLQRAYRVYKWRSRFIDMTWEKIAAKEKYSNIRGAKRAYQTMLKFFAV